MQVARLERQAELLDFKLDMAREAAEKVALQTAASAQQQSKMLENKGVRCMPPASDVTASKGRLICIAHNAPAWTLATMCVACGCGRRTGPVSQQDCTPPHLLSPSQFTQGCHFAPVDCCQQSVPGLEQA